VVAIRLTQYARGGGCACKIRPGELETILTGLASSLETDSLIVGAGGDAAVVRLNAQTAEPLPD
jgi:selenide,water dikinase